MFDIIKNITFHLFQLIDDKVSVLRYRSDKTVICDSDYIREKLGISPCQYADYKSLTGDNADNIIGAHRVGPKTAALLINQFGSLDNILMNADQISKPSIKASISSDKERLLQNYSMIKLDNRAEIVFELDKLVLTYDGVTTNEVLQGIGLR